VLDGLNIRSSHEKEVKHILKIINIWSIRDRDKKESGSVSVFPKSKCEAWTAMLNSRAAACGLKLNSDTAAAVLPGTDAAPAAPSQAPISTAGTADVTGPWPVQQVKVYRITARLSTIQPTSQPSQLSQAASSSSSSSSSSGAPTPGASHTNLTDAPVSGTSAAVASPVPDFKAQMDINMVHTMCQFQMQIFQSFMENAKRRLDRWNMRVVMNASYFLLHLYVQEYGVADVHAAALVVACIYLAGKVSTVLLLFLLLSRDFVSQCLHPLSRLL
jgi:hypothetical protein